MQENTKKSDIAGETGRNSVFLEKLVAANAQDNIEDALDALNQIPDTVLAKMDPKEFKGTYHLTQDVRESVEHLVSHEQTYWLSPFIDRLGAHVLSARKALEEYHDRPVELFFELFPQSSIDKNRLQNQIGLRQKEVSLAFDIYDSSVFEDLDLYGSGAARLDAAGECFQPNPKNYQLQDICSVYFTNKPRMQRGGYQQKEVDEHENQHVLHELINDEEQASESIGDLSDNRLRGRDEILAYMKDGSDKKTVYEKLLRPGWAYDYFYDDHREKVKNAFSAVFEGIEFDVSRWRASHKKRKSSRDEYFHLLQQDIDDAFVVGADRINLLSITAKVDFETWGHLANFYVERDGAQEIS